VSNVLTEMGNRWYIIGDCAMVLTHCANIYTNLNFGSTEYTPNAL